MSSECGRLEHVIMAAKASASGSGRHTFGTWNRIGRFGVGVCAKAAEARPPRLRVGS